MAIGGKRIYNKTFREMQVVLWDVFPVSDSEMILLTFESKNSDWRQGVWLMCDNGLSINELFSKSISIWYETAPKQNKITCYSSSGILNVYNIWDRGYGQSSQANTSGMLLEELPRGRRYRCNDIGMDTKFDKIVFKIERIENKKYGLL